jgi:hypothetical protein
MSEQEIHNLDPNLRVLVTAQNWSVSLEIERQVDALWKAKKTASQFDGRVFALKEIRPERITGFFVPYRYMAAKQWCPDLPYQLETLAVSGLVGCDGAVLAGRRSQDVLQYPGYWELLPSGAVDEGSEQASQVDYRQQLLRELREESGVPTWPIKSWRPLCLLKEGLVWDLCVRIELEKRVAVPRKTAEYTEIAWYSAASKEGALWVPTSKCLFLISAFF